ncbi:flagellar biosynthesis protein FliQ [bacterium]|nr:flagellar biosynthesis protein FliQ [bacterium]
MTQQFVIHLSREAIYHTFLIAGPILGLALIVGLFIGIFQAVTSINEMTLTFIPKIIVVFGAVIVFGPWMMRIIVTFTMTLISQIPLIAH